MALGYEIGTIMKRTSTSYSDDRISIKLDDIEGMDQTFVQVATAPNVPPLLNSCALREESLHVQCKTCSIIHSLPFFWPPPSLSCVQIFLKQSKP